MGEPQQLGLLVQPEAESLPAYPPMTQEQIEERNQRYLKAALAETALARWQFYCPPELQETDFTHKDLRPYAALHKTILDWKWNKKGIMATGPTGRGKSRSMWQLMRRLASEGRDIRYFTAAEFFTQMQAENNYGRDNADAWVKAYAKVAVLFIDDLGQEAVATAKEDWCRARWFQLLDLRLGFGLPLFTTTNLTATQMAERTTEVRAEPMVRRLLELAEPVRF